MARGKVSKNGPCPCGSGRRYKSCCLKTDGARTRAFRRAREQRAGEQRVNGAVIDAIMDVLHRLQANPYENAPGDPEHPFLEDLLPAWAAYQPTTLDTLHSILSDSLTSEQNDWLIRQHLAHIGLWHVRGIDGPSLDVRDELTGAEHSVLDPRWATLCEPDDVLLARVVPIAKQARIVGAYAVPLDKDTAPILVRLMRLQMADVCGYLTEGLLTPEQMRDHRAIYLLIDIVHHAVMQQRQHVLTSMSAVVHEDWFAFAPHTRVEVATMLDGTTALQRTEDDHYEANPKGPLPEGGLMLGRDHLVVRSGTEGERAPWLDALHSAIPGLTPIHSEGLTPAELAGLDPDVHIPLPAGIRAALEGDRQNEP